MEGKRAVGVKLVEGETLSAVEVVLAAGVFGSPAILLLSGSGRPSICPNTASSQSPIYR
jgi:choline dehydrogenase